jgi:glycosyltransferase involved in cell wall biosynthesis
MIPTEWILIMGVLIAVVLLFDSKCTDQLDILPLSQVQSWSTVETPENRIRMLWIVHSYVPFVNAGSEICAHTINTHLMQKPYKYDIWVASPGFPKITYENVRCFDLYDSATFLQIVNSAHVIHSHSYIYRNQMRYICKKRGIPFVEWVHTDNYVRSIPYGKWVDPAIRNRHWTVFNSKSLRDSRSGDIVGNRTHVVYPVVDYRKYQIPEEDKKPQYVTLSNVNENKGGDILIQLAKALPEFQFMGVLGGYRAQITETKIPNLRYVQNTPDMKPIYAQTWVQIMPSKEETWGRTAVEAMSAGIPVLVNPTPGLRECCDSAAIYCNRADISEWISALQRLKTDKEWYNSRATISYERARALDPKPALEQLEEWLEKEVLPTGANKKRDLTAQENILLFR